MDGQEHLVNTQLPISHGQHVLPEWAGPQKILPSLRAKTALSFCRSAKWYALSPGHAHCSQAAPQPKPSSPGRWELSCLAFRPPGVQEKLVCHHQVEYSICFGAQATLQPSSHKSLQCQAHMHGENSFWRQLQTLFCADWLETRDMKSWNQNHHPQRTHLLVANPTNGFGCTLHKEPCLQRPCPSHPALHLPRWHATFWVHSTWMDWLAFLCSVYTLIPHQNIFWKKWGVTVATFQEHAEQKPMTQWCFATSIQEPLPTFLRPRKHRNQLRSQEKSVCVQRLTVWIEEKNALVWSMSEGISSRTGLASYAIGH